MNRVKFICATSFASMHGYTNHIEEVIFPAIRDLETQLEEANKLLMFLEPNLEDEMQDKVTEYLDRNDSIKVSQ